MSGETGLLKTGNISREPKVTKVSDILLEAGILAPTIPMRIIVRSLLDEMGLNPQFGLREMHSFERRVEALFGQTGDSQVAEVYYVMNFIFRNWDIPPARRTSLLGVLPRELNPDMMSALRSPTKQFTYHSSRQE